MRVHVGVLLLVALQACGGSSRDAGDSAGRGRHATLPSPPDAGPPVAPAGSALPVPANRRDACVAWEAILRHAATRAGMPPSEVAPPRDTVMVFGETGAAPTEPACIVIWSNATSKDAPVEGVYELAQASGWRQREHLLSADGPDGPVLAFSRGADACVVAAQWDGGDDSDSTYVAAPGFRIVASCFPDRPDRY